MEVGVDVWLKDICGKEAWLEAIVESKNYTNDGIEIHVRTEVGNSFKFK